MIASCFFVCLLVSAQTDQPPVVKNFALVDAAGKKHSASDWKNTKAVVMFFLSPDCPVSNFYCPEYGRLAKTFADKGVQFYGVHPDPFVTAEDAAKHAGEFQLRFPILLDPKHTITEPSGVTVTPEAVVLSSRGQVLYRGRIDDRYNSAGVRREVPTTRDLENALQAILAGGRPAVAHTPAFGCPLPAPRK